MEDNRSDANLIKEIIADTKIEHQMTWLHDGEEALTYFERGGKADFIILDLNLPKVNGHEVLRLLKAHEHRLSIPIIIMTGSSSPLDRALARERGVECYLVKPMTIDEIDQTAMTLANIFTNPDKCSMLS